MYAKRITVLLMLMMGSIFTAMAGGKKTDPVGKTVIRFQIGWDSESGRGKAIQDVVDMFNSGSDSIVVETISGNKENLQKLLTTLISSDAPEVVQMQATSLPDYREQGLLAPIDGMDDALRGVEMAVVTQLRDDSGNLYAVPWIGHTIAVCYNKDLFAEAGLDPEKTPATWEELMEMAAIIEENTDADGFAMVGGQTNATAWHAITILGGYDSFWLQGETGSEKMNINNPAGIAALTTIQQLAAAYTAAGEKSGADGMDDFRSGRVAMQMQGPWGVTDVWKSGASFEVGAFPPPVGGSSVQPYTGTTAIALTLPSSIKDQQKIDAAKEFMRFLATDEEAMTRIVKGEYDQGTDGYYLFRLPINTKFQNLAYIKENPVFTAYMNGFAFGRNNFPTPASAKLDSDLMQPTLNSLALGNITPEEAAQKLEEEGNVIIKNYYSN